MLALKRKLVAQQAAKKDVSKEEVSTDHSTMAILRIQKGVFSFDFLRYF